MDILSEYGNMDIMLGEGIITSIEWDLDSIINGPEGQPDTQSLPCQIERTHLKRMRSEIDNRNEPVRQGGLSESINKLSDEMNARFSRKMDSMMDLIQSQINRGISSAINDRVIPEIQSIMGNLPLSRNGLEPCTSLNEEGIGNAWKNKNTNFPKKDSRSACDLTEDTDFTP